MSVYRRILVTTDFSEINLVAAKRAVQMAKQDKCELILLHVIEHFSLDSDPLSSVFNYNTESVEALGRHMRARLDEMKTELRYPDIETALRITAKSARHEILRFAEAHDVDLIVVAPHGQGIIGMLGSTANGILNSAVCDVLAVRKAGEAN